MSYWFVSPVLIFLGLAGSLTNLIILSGQEFNTSTFYYLRALSCTDMMYLVLVTGYLAEITLIDDDQDNYSAKYYLTHWDVNLCNTFITASGFIILLLTIDRWDDIKHGGIQFGRKSSARKSLSNFLTLLFKTHFNSPRYGLYSTFERTLT